MLHRGLGTARITYPRTVQLSPADPMTNAAMPAILLRVPGVVSRPIRIGALPQSEQALIALMIARQAKPNDLALRDAEHAAFSRYVIDKLGPVIGPAVVATSVPVYSAAKGAIQIVGGMKAATPASFREIRAGLRPLLPSQSPAIVGYQAVGVWPGAVLATGAQCAAYVASHGDGPGSGCQAVYSDGSLGPVSTASTPTSAAAPTTFKAPLWVHPQARAGYSLRLRGVDYYPNLGQTYGGSDSVGGGVPTWVWWVAGYGVLALLLGGYFYAAPARRQPTVRTVTRTTY